jgi:Ricin-type beta-trefoil lectin domain
MLSTTGAALEVEKMMRRLMFLLIFGGCAVLLVAVSGCGASYKPDPVQIELAIYTPDCVDILDASTTAGANLQLYSCGAGKKSQEWEMIGFGNDQTEIMNENSQMCMSVINDPPVSPDSALGQWVVQEPCSKDGSDPTQLWHITPAPSGEAGIRLVSAASGDCFDDPYGMTDAPDSFHLQQYSCTADDPAQGWTLNPVALGNTP